GWGDGWRLPRPRCGGGAPAGRRREDRNARERVGGAHAPLGRALPRARPRGLAVVARARAARVAVLRAAARAAARLAALSARAAGAGARARSVRSGSGGCALRAQLRLAWNTRRAA